MNGPRMGWLVLVHKCALCGIIDFFSAWRLKKKKKKKKKQTQNNQETVFTLDLLHVQC